MLKENKIFQKHTGNHYNFEKTDLLCSLQKDVPEFYSDASKLYFTNGQIEHH